jgi:CBS-domain-containing membrane protein
MKRVNVKAAFVGEPTSSQEGLEVEGEEEAVVIAVRGGELTLVVPAGTADDELVPSASVIRGALRLENQRVFTFEINQDAVGAFFEDEPAQLHRRRLEEGSVGLSSIGDVDYMADAATVGQIMTTKVITVTPSTSVQELSRLLAFHRISGVPVVDGERVVGVVSEADVIGRPGKTVGEIMTRDPITVTEELPLEQLARLLTERRIKRVPVLRGERLVGIVSQSDIVRWTARH